jgi:hypothetical protein
MKRIFILCAVFALSGCGEKQEPVSVARSDNQSYPISKLFTHDGVTVYRFHDEGRPVYFTSPSSNLTYSHTEACGKGCTKSVTTQTLGL